MKKIKLLLAVFACIVLLSACKTRHKPGCLSLKTVVELVKK